MDGDWDEPLSALRWHWGSAYIICHPEPDVWIAERRDNHETLRATTPLGLRDEIITDYFSRPVIRAVPVYGEHRDKSRPRLRPGL
jgi:hypothetical protein